VEFYAPWCGHCKRLTPEWEQAATKLKGLVRIGAINCDDEKNKPLAGYFGIQGFPTIKFFGDKSELTPDKKGVVKKPVDYNGAREANAIVQYALSQLPTDYITLVKTDAEYAQIKEKNFGHPIVLLFTDKTTTTPLARALSLDFPVFYQVTNAVKTALADFGVETFPKIVVQSIDGSKQFYEGKLEHQPIYKFLEQHIYQGAHKQQAKASKPEPAPQPIPKKEELFQVWKINSQAVFEEHCISRFGLCAIGFLDPEDEDSFDDYLTILNAVGQRASKKSAMQFFWADGPKRSDSAAAFEISSYPGFTIFSPSKKSYVPYFGAFQESKLDAFIGQVLQGKKGSVPLDVLPTFQNLKDEL